MQCTTYHCVLAKFQVELLGASINTIKLAEDRTLFHNKMKQIGLDVPRSFVANNKNEALQAMACLGFPLIVRTSFSLGGSGAAVVYKEAEAIAVFNTAFSKSQCQQITLDEGLFGWKEFELEVVRDKKDNCIVVCGVENFDPLGIHTGDSITVAPIQTLTDHEYQIMRNAAFAVLRAVGVETGGSNVQFAINPKTGRMVVIEMNPRVSRSSALVSKATGFPIAKIAAKLAIGYTLDELQNDITEGHLPASFEPSIDYTIIKIPRFADEKFNAEHLSLGPEMRSVGEIMAIGSTFSESLQHAICSLDTRSSGFDGLPALTDEELKSLLTSHTSTHLWIIAESFRRGFSLEDIHASTFIDPWFLHQIKSLIAMEQGLFGTPLFQLNKEALLGLKKSGFSDERIALLTQSTEKKVREYRQKFNIVPVYKCIDSCAGEFKTATAYLYSTYQEYCESKPSTEKKILIVGSGPNRIGQGIEFDYICVKAIEAFAKAGFETIMVNCNPETVSTDYDVANKLYFVPINHEKILDIIEKEKPDAVALQFGGQTPLNLLETLEQAGVTLIGLNADVVNVTEDRDQFRSFLHQLNLKQPVNHIINNINELDHLLPSLLFPLIIRPSFILGGRGMEIIMDEPTLRKQLTTVFRTTRMMVSCLCNNKNQNKDFELQSLQALYQLVKHPSKTRHLLSGMELKPDDILNILKLASDMKKDPSDYCNALDGKNLVMIFEKPSFRTRLSFTLAMENMGGTASESISNTRKQEEPGDLIRVLNGYCDFVMVRTHDDSCLQEMARYSTQPIINGLSALHHPCQTLADLLSLQECFGRLDGLTLAYVGDGNNILHSLLLMAPHVGMKINYCCPAEHQPDAKILLQSKCLFHQMITTCSTPEEAVLNAHAVYTDVWTSMGFEQQKFENDFHRLQVNESLMSQAKPEAVFMHCMPMERGKEVSISLPDTPCSIIFSQSENRLHVQKALLIFMGLNEKYSGK